MLLFLFGGSVQSGEWERVISKTFIAQLVQSASQQQNKIDESDGWLFHFADY